MGRVGKGRVAMLTSDQVWLWGRGFEGGGPQLELLRRIAHWSMKEPELEEEALLADVAGGLTVTITRRTMAPDAKPVRITLPGGETRLFVEAGDDETGRFRFPLPDRLSRRIDKPDGHEVVLGLRPETIFAAGSELPGKDRFIFEATVDVVEPTGPDTMLVFRIGGHELIARVRPEDAPEPGGPFRFETEMGKAKLFDQESGIRM